jgi:SAM-dependent methyltransferase
MDFLRLHIVNAVNIPLEELSSRVHELPSANVAIRVADTDPDRAKQAARFLEQRGNFVTVGAWTDGAATQAGPSRARLWSPSPFLLEALPRLRVTGETSHATPLRALDVACGTGRDAVYLARQAFEVIALDVLPDALHRAKDLARRNEVQIQTIASDLEHGGSLPPGQFDLVTVFRYLHRPLIPALSRAVGPGGYIVYETFHERNASRGHRPRNPAHLLKTGELSQAFGDFEIVIERDAIERDGRFFSSLLARRPCQ